MAKENLNEIKSKGFMVYYDWEEAINEFDDKEFNFTQIDVDNNQAVEFIKSFEDNLKEKKRKKKKKGLEQFLEE